MGSGVVRKGVAAHAPPGGRGESCDAELAAQWPRAITRVARGPTTPAGLFACGPGSILRRSTFDVRDADGGHATMTTQR